MQLFSAPPVSSAPVYVPEDVPVYRVGDGRFYADDVLYGPGTIISWPDEPCESLEPLNAKARENMMAFLEKLDDLGRKAAEKAGNSYVSRVSAFENAYALAKQEGRRVSVLNGPQKKQILGARIKNPRGRKIEISPSVHDKIKHLREEIEGKDEANSSMGVA